MSEPVTFCFADFAGRRRKLELRLGEVEELERICCPDGAGGVGAIMTRIATHQFKSADVMDTVRLGLQGGGMDATEAEALVTRRFTGRPLAVHLPLAMQILEAYVNGLPDESKKNDDAAIEDSADALGTSAPSTASAE